MKIEAGPGSPLASEGVPRGSRARRFVASPWGQSATGKRVGNDHGYVRVWVGIYGHARNRYGQLEEEGYFKRAGRKIAHSFRLKKS